MAKKIPADRSNPLMPTKKGGKVSLGEDLLVLKVELLKKTDLFRALPEKTIKVIAEEAKDIFFEKDEVLFREGDQEKDIKIYIILSGEMVIYKGDVFRKRVAILGPGEFAGEMAVLDSKPRSATAEALSDLVLMEISEELFNRYIASDKEVLLEMLKVFSYRVRNDLDTMSGDLQKVSNFTHDMRNCIAPLDIAQHLMGELIGILVGTSQEHKKRKGCEKIDRTFHNMLKARNNLLTLIDQTLACVKKVATDYVKAEFCALELVEETVEEISYHKNFNGKTIRVNADSELQPVYINCLDIKRVLQNLLLNAGYFSEKNSHIDVYLRGSEGAVQIIVRDYGAGIPEDIQDVLFKRNFTSRPDGNGFGLMSCREIIEDFHQGDIWFETELGKGTDFCFSIPHSLT